MKKKCKEFKVSYSQNGGKWKEVDGIIGISFSENWNKPYNSKKRKMMSTKNYSITGSMIIDDDKKPKEFLNALRKNEKINLKVEKSNKDVFFVAKNAEILARVAGISIDDTSYEQQINYIATELI